MLQMEVKVKIDPAVPLCNVCFSCTDEVSLITDFGEVFIMLLQNSSIEVTNDYLATLKACENCATALKHMSNMRDILINNINENIKFQEELRKDVKEMEPDGLLCSICLTYNQEVYSVNDLGDPLQMLVKGSHVDITENQLNVMECCIHCRTNLENIAQFQSAVVEEHLKMLSNLAEEEIKVEENDIDSASPAKTLKKEKTDYEISASNQSEDADNNLEPSFFCHECNQDYKTRKLLYNHLNFTLIHASERKHVCKICEKVFYSSRYLEDHIKFKHQGHGTECKLCGKMCQGRRGLRQHIQFVHKRNKKNTKKRTPSAPSNLRTYQCEDCGFVLKNYISYRSHRIKNHRPKEDAYCKSCNIQFKHIYKLRRHLKQSVNHNRKMYICEHCDRSFSFKPLLAGHIQFVHEQKGHKCPLCHKIFPPPYGLPRHMRRVHHLRKTKTT